MNEQPQSRTSFLDRISNSVSLKAFMIFIISLFLLIPASQIRSLVYERQGLSEKVEQDIGNQTALAQVIGGPILSVPCLYETKVDKKGKKSTYTKYLHILPSTLDVVSELQTSVKKRGIYDAKYYEGDFAIKASFDTQIKKPAGALKIQWEDAKFDFGISDQRGIKRVDLKINGQQIEIAAGLSNTEVMDAGFSTGFPSKSNVKKGSKYDIDLSLRLLGTSSIQFIPAGKKSTFSLKSDWPHPSYFGNFLPENSADSSLVKTWTVLELNRTFPQSWVGGSNSKAFNDSSFGLIMLDGVDRYQKVHRLVRYALLIIGLTFLVFFIVEILKGYKVHPFQYILVGVSLVIFFTMLIGLVEHMSFNIAFAISALSISLLVSLYSWNLFGNLNDAGIVFGLLFSIYLFMYVTVQMEDYALMMGSIGLFIIISITMYATRKIDWYNINLRV
jgi:inner membrane protein